MSAKNKKLVVVTGGTKGIGKSIIECFASKRAFDIVTCARNKEELDSLSSEISNKYDCNVFYKVCDLSIKEDCLSFAGYVLALKMDVEILINNTGTFIPGSMHDELDQNFELMMNTNLNSAYYLTKPLVSQMKKRKSGSVFNICSTASIMAYPNGGSYCISKFALYGLTKVLREELKEYGIKVTAVLPGATLTSSWDGVDLPPERFMKPEDVASAILNTYEMSDNSVVEEILIRPQLGDI